MYRIVSVTLLSSLAMLGCSSAEQGASAAVTPAVTVAADTSAAATNEGPVESKPAAAPAVATKLPPLTNDAELQRWLEAPCFALSQKNRQLACIHAELEMGFVNAVFTVLTADGGKVVVQHQIYEGPSDVDASKNKQDGITAANKLLMDGGFVADGRAIAAKDVTTADGFFASNATGVRMAGKVPPFASDDGPQGFTGDVNACMSWQPAKGVAFKWVTAVRVDSQHRFTTKAGNACSVKAGTELNDEAYPSQGNWVLLHAK